MSEMLAFPSMLDNLQIVDMSLSQQGPNPKNAHFNHVLGNISMSRNSEFR